MSTSTATSSTAKEIAPFLRNLRRLLDTEHASVICWTADGVAFEIHDLAQLVAHVLPKYFKHAKYSSFQRQLNYFHFRKWTRSKTAVCTFSNPHFQRDAPDLTWRISRKKSSPSTTATVSKATKKADAKTTNLSIVVPSPWAKGTVAAEFDGLKSPTDAAAMIHHHQQQQQTQVDSPLADPEHELPLPLALPPALPLAQAPYYTSAAWLDWSYHHHHHQHHSNVVVETPELLPLDWIDSLYSSLDTALPRGRVL